MPDLRTANQLAHAEQALAAGRFGEAAAVCERLLKKQKSDVAALELAGRVALEVGDFPAAMKRFRRCESLRPKDPRYQYLIGQTLAEQGRLDDAMTRFDRVLRAKPDAAAVVAAKARIWERRGETAEALGAVQDLIDAGGESVSTVELYARCLIRTGQAEHAAEHIQSRLDEDRWTPRERKGLLFSLARAFDKLGDYDQAFAAAAQANQIDPGGFEPQRLASLVDDLIDFFDEARCAELARATPSDLPIFIAGMPRSGTTLVEQILDAHGKIHGEGELTTLPQLVSNLTMELDSYEPYPHCLEDLTAAKAERLGAAHRDFLRGHDRTAGRIVDKTLDNLLHLGLVWLLHPGGRVIFTQRDPRDVCISCFLNHIMPQRFGYVSDLGHLGTTHRQLRRLADHWRAVLPWPSHTVVYEDLIERPKELIPPLIEFTGLDWDQRCMQFYETGRPVMTLSYDQVNQPMYQTAAGRWKNYEKHLGPLFDALGAE